VGHFLPSLQAELAEINGIFRKPADMIMTANDRRAFTDATSVAKHSMMTGCATIAIYYYYYYLFITPLRQHSKIQADKQYRTHKHHAR